jgi:hypothetical protein
VLVFRFYMLKRINILMVIAVFGLFLLPEQSYACALHSNETAKKEMPCCSVKDLHQDTEQKQHSEKGTDMDCCKNKHQDDKKCSGSCGMQSCHSTTFSFTATPPICKQALNDFNFKNKKSYPLYVQNTYTLREFSIWQPPKIS